MHDDDQTNEPDDSGDEDNRPSDADDPTPTGDAEHFPPSAGGKDPDGQFTQRVRHSQVSALVPEDVARGIFATGALVLNGPHEFVVDFLQAMTRPQQVACRIILPPTIMANMVKALRQNIENYEKRFGDLPPIPKPNNAPEKPPTPPSIEDIYDQLKVPEGVASGIYANTVLITHSATEFCLDFITSFYPRSSVAARIYMAVPQLARVTETLDRSWQQYQQKLAQQREMLAAQAAQAKVLRTPEEVAELNAQISGAPAEVAPTDADRDIDKAPGEEAGDQDASVESKDDDVIVWGKDAKGQGDASADSNEEASNDDPADDDDLSDDDRKADDAA